MYRKGKKCFAFLPQKNGSFQGVNVVVTLFGDFRQFLAKKWRFLEYQ
jgi:hypothetical protein